MTIRSQGAKAPVLFPPGAQILVRDEVWLVRNATRTEHDGVRVEAVGASGFVRDQELDPFNHDGTGPLPALKHEGTWHV